MAHSSFPEGAKPSSAAGPWCPSIWVPKSWGAERRDTHSLPFPWSRVSEGHRGLSLGVVGCRGEQRPAVPSGSLV
jgi:hypothetical protein